MKIFPACKELKINEVKVLYHKSFTTYSIFEVKTNMYGLYTYMKDLQDFPLKESPTICTRQHLQMGLDARKPVFGGLRTTKAQTRLGIRTV